MRAKAKGAKIIVVDPRTTQMSMLADLHIKQQPGTDVVWLNGMMNIIISEGLADETSLPNAQKDLKIFMRLLLNITPEYVEEIARDPGRRTDCRQPRCMARPKEASIVYAMGITQHTTGVDNVLSCANLAMLTGNVGRPSTGVNPLRGQNNVQGACDLGGLPNVYPGYQRVNGSKGTSEIRERLGTQLIRPNWSDSHRDGGTELDLVISKRCM